MSGMSETMEKVNDKYTQPQSQSRDEHAENIRAYVAAIKAVKGGTFTGEVCHAIDALLKFLEMNRQAAQLAFEKASMTHPEWGDSAKKVADVPTASTGGRVEVQ